MMQLIFTIEDGSTSVEVMGGDGKNCLEATKPYEDRLGDTEYRQTKPEMRKTQQVITQQQLQQK